MSSQSIVQWQIKKFVSQSTIVHYIYSYRSFRAASNILHVTELKILTNNIIFGCIYAECTSFTSALMNIIIID